MNGQMKRYRESLKNTQGPVFLSDCKPMKMDLSGMIRYAKEKGVQPVNLSDEEKEKFYL